MISVGRSDALNRKSTFEIVSLHPGLVSKWSGVRKIRAHACVRGAADPPKRQVCRKLVLVFAPKPWGVVGVIMVARSRGLASAARRVVACSPGDAASRVQSRTSDERGPAVGDGQSLTAKGRAKGDNKHLSLDDRHRMHAEYLKLKGSGAKAPPGGVKARQHPHQGGGAALELPGRERERPWVLPKHECSG